MDNIVVRHRKRIVALARRPRNRKERYHVMFFLVLLFLGFGITSLSCRQPDLLHKKKSSRLQDAQISVHHSVHRYGCGSTEDLRRLLQNIILAQEFNTTPSIVILVVNYAYRTLALNFVCNLTRLGVTNYLIFAMDKRVFEYLVLQKANTFLHTDDGLSIEKGNLSGKEEKEDMFGTRAFVETSIRKSILVLNALTLGYSVIFSDVDVVWIRNPIPELLSKPEDIVIQSDKSLLEWAAPPNHKLNSGLYLARSNSRTIIAFRAIVKYARAIRRSEQKAFNYVLCGAFKSYHAGPGSRVGTTKCIYTPRGTTVSTLALKHFPNGSDNKLWASTTNFSKAHPYVFAIHANYVVSRTEKVKRIQRLGFWFLSGAQTTDACSFRS